MEHQCLSYSNGTYSTVSLQVLFASDEKRHMFQPHGWRTEIGIVLARVQKRIPKKVFSVVM